MIVKTARAEPATHDPEPPPSLMREQRYLIATVCRHARANGWRNGHRLGWVHQHQGVAVSARPGVLSLWWRGPAGRWPTHPVSHPVVSVNDAMHVLIERKLLPGWYCDHGREALAGIARICELAAADLDQQTVVPLAGDEAVAARVWREAARRAREVAGLAGPA